MIETILGGGLAAAAVITIEKFAEFLIDRFGKKKSATEIALLALLRERNRVDVYRRLRAKMVGGYGGIYLYFYENNRLAIHILPSIIGAVDSNTSAEKVSFFKAWLAANKPEVEYQLATPPHHHIPRRPAITHLPTLHARRAGWRRQGLLITRCQSHRLLKRRML